MSSVHTCAHLFARFPWLPHLNREIKFLLVFPLMLQLMGYAWLCLEK